MNTDWSPTTRPARAGGGNVAPDPADVGVVVVAANTKQAATSVRYARHLTTVVSSWNRLLIRTPAHWRPARPTSTATATGLIAGASAGTSLAVNSPIVIET